MNANERISIYLYSELLEWLAWREGRESLLLDIDVEQWSKSRAITSQCRELLPSPDYSWQNPREMLYRAMLILSIAQGKTVREEYRTISSRVRNAQRGYGDCSRLDQSIAYLLCNA